MKQLKSELAALDRKIQLELATPKKKRMDRKSNRMRKVYGAYRHNKPMMSRRFEARLGISLPTMSSSDDRVFRSRMITVRKG